VRFAAVGLGPAHPSGTWRRKDPSQVSSECRSMHGYWRSLILTRRSRSLMARTCGDARTATKGTPTVGCCYSELACFEHAILVPCSARSCRCRDHADAARGRDGVASSGHLHLNRVISTNRPRRSLLTAEKYSLGRAAAARQLNELTVSGFVGVVDDPDQMP
jgi:hypothetical protein